MSIVENQLIIENHPLLQKLTAQSQHELAKYGTLQKLSKKEHLFWNQDIPEHLFLVVDGLVILYRINSLGERKIFFTFGKNQIINEEVLQGMPSSVSCEALVNSLILSFPQEEISKLIGKDPEFGKILFYSLSQKMRRAYRQLKNTSNSIRGDKKIAAKLWRLSGDPSIILREEGKIKVLITITFLADMLGSKRESVSRQLKQLAEKELIQISDGGIWVLDREKLADYFKSP